MAKKPPPKDTHTQMAQELDAVLLKVLKDGQVMVNPETNQPMVVTPTAALLGVVRQRLKDLQIGGLAVPESSTAHLLNHAKALRIAPISDEPDDIDDFKRASA
jgi:hypothetical protein